MFISESRFLTFNLYNLFSLGFLILCILFLPISTFFLATLSLPRVCFFSLCSKRFAPSLPQVSLSSPNFLVELAGKRSLRKLSFLPFLRSWRSFCDETVIFAKRRLTILQTSIADPLLFQNVPRANGPTIYAGYSC